MTYLRFLSSIMVAAAVFLGAAVESRSEERLGISARLPSAEGRPGKSGQSRVSPSDTIRVGSVSGKVTVAATGEPVENVRIVIEELQRGAVTNRDGRFLLFDVPAGRYTLVALTSPSDTTLIRGVDVKPGSTTTIGFSVRSLIKPPEIR